MFVDPKMMNRVSTMTQHMVSQLTPKQQEAFWMQFAPQSKDPGTIVLLSIFFPIQFFLLGKTGLGIAFLLTSGGCGIWWLVEIFTANGRAIAYNDEIAQRIMMIVKSSNQ